MNLLLLFLSFLYFLQSTFSTKISWNSSIISFYTEDEGTNQIRVIIQSNREIYRNFGGHFQILINASSSLYGNVNGTSQCIEIGMGVAPMIKLLQNSPIKFQKRNQTELLGKYIDVSVKRVGDGKIESHFKTIYYFSFTSSIISNIAITVSTIFCTPMETIGLWSDHRNWKTGIVPRTTDSVFLPQDAGFIQLTNDIQITSLNMQGGVLIAHNSPCPYGWSLSPSNSVLGYYILSSFYPLSLSHTHTLVLLLPLIANVINYFKIHKLI